MNELSVPYPERTYEPVLFHFCEITTKHQISCFLMLIRFILVPRTISYFSTCITLESVRQKFDKVRVFHNFKIMKNWNLEQILDRILLIKCLYEYIGWLSYTCIQPVLRTNLGIQVNELSLSSLTWIPKFVRRTGWMHKFVERTYAPANLKSSKFSITSVR